jgi:Glycosyl hydrolases family 39
MPARRTSLQVLMLIVALPLHCASAADSATSTATIPSSYFGLHIHHLDNPTPVPWPSVPVPEWRLWDAGVNWPDLEPNKGQWHFERLDRYLSLAQQHGTSVLLPLGGSPWWASTRPQLASPYSPGFTAAPANLDDWRTYVRTVVTRYKGRIPAYEIWNEPNLNDFWSGTTDQMLALTREASQIIHSVDPSALVVSPSATADFGIPWLQAFLQQGGGQFVDVIGYHFYVNPHTKSPEEMVSLIEDVRQVIAANHLQNKPLWNTECGWLQPAHFDSDEAAAGYLARAFVLAWAAGIQRFYWYAWDNKSLAVRTYDETDRIVLPAGRAFEVIQRWLVGAQMVNCTTNPDDIRICQLNRAGKKNWIVWNPRGNRKFDAPKAWQVASITRLLHDRTTPNGSSIEIGPAPVLVEGRLRADAPKK